MISSKYPIPSPSVNFALVTQRALTQQSDATAIRPHSFRLPRHSSKALLIGFSFHEVAKYDLLGRGMDTILIYQLFLQDTHLVKGLHTGYKNATRWFWKTRRDERRIRFKDLSKCLFLRD